VFASPYSKVEMFISRIVKVLKGSVEYHGRTSAHYSPTDRLITQLPHDVLAGGVHADQDGLQRLLASLDVVVGHELRRHGADVDEPRVPQRPPPDRTLVTLPGVDVTVRGRRRHPAAPTLTAVLTGRTDLTCPAGRSGPVTRPMAAVPSDPVRPAGPATGPARPPLVD